MAEQSWLNADSMPKRCPALVISEPREVGLRELTVRPPGPTDVAVRILYTGVSTGTEKLLFSGDMPEFPGMGYPLVPGYEALGEIVSAGADSGLQAGDRVFVPGANCFEDARGLFGASASWLVVPAERAVPVAASLGASAVLLALAATAQHALAVCLERGGLPSLIVGHGVLGRLLARLTVANGGAPPTVWERASARREGAVGYPVLDATDDPRQDHAVVVDASGDAGIVDALLPRLARRGQVVLAGFYAEPIRFDFPPAFMREAGISIAAEWRPDDLDVVRAHLAAGRLSLEGLVSHVLPAEEAATAYARAFEDPDCLKLVLDWREL